MPRLPESFLNIPFAHRGLHDAEKGVGENSYTSFVNAIAGGYGIELDLQLSSDGEAMVFHDYSLERLTNETGPIRMRSAEELRRLSLKVGGEAILALSELTRLVNGRVPLLIELKDQDGACGPNVGPLEQRTAEVLSDYTGEAAVMSFNPHSVQAMSELAPDIPRGLTTCVFDEVSWPLLPRKRAQELDTIPDFDRVGASFVSHDWQTLDSGPIASLKDRKVPILCWTIRDIEEEEKARRIADNITFEGYTPLKRQTDGGTNA